MRINKVTITGADDSTNPKDLIELSKKFPFVEWGILFSPTRTGEERYPSIEWVNKFTLLKRSIGIRLNLSAHLCGKYTSNLLDTGNLSLAEKDLGDTLLFFNRIQLNFNSSKTKPNKVFFDFFSQKKFGYYNSECIKYILQHNKSNSAVTSVLLNRYEYENIDFLYDGSGGRGVLPDKYFEPIKDYYTGYAGGLNPDNIIEALNKINEVAGENEEIWVDTESGVRTAGKLDLKKVVHFLQNCDAYNKAHEKTAPDVKNFDNNFSVDFINKQITSNPIDRGSISDGWHTFKELYAHRNNLFIALCRYVYETSSDGSSVWKTRFDFENKYCGDGWFIMGIGTEKGKQVTYHLPYDLWDECSFVNSVDKVPAFDGHNSNDVLKRLSKL